MGATVLNVAVFVRLLAVQWIKASSALEIESPSSTTTLDLFLEGFFYVIEPFVCDLFPRI
jgi:hypothetical protein